MSRAAWVCLFLALAGCDPSRPAKKPNVPATPTAAAPATTASGLLLTSTSSLTADAAGTAALEFLRLITADPKAAAAKVAPDFNRLFFTTDALTDWLAAQGKGLTGPSIAARTDAPGGRTAVLRGTGSRNGQEVKFAVRTTQASGGWQVSWFLLGQGDSQAPPADSELLWARETAMDFLEAFLLAAPKDDFALALSLMSEPGKAKLGGSDNVRRQLLRPRKQGLTGISVKQQKVTGAAAEIAGALSGATRSAEFALKLIRTADGIWRIDDFELKN